MNKLWKQWTINCALGELIGIACAGAIAYAVFKFVGEPITLFDKLITLVAMVFAGFVEGMVLSHFQWKVLVKKFKFIPQREWQFYTVLIAVIGWFIGMLPSLFFMPSNVPSQGASNSLNYDNPIVFALLSILAGLSLGALFGLFQWFSLRKYAHKVYKWILANALGWGLGLGWIYLFASMPNEQSSMLFNISVGLIGGTLAGLSLGAISGFFLIRLEVKNK